MDISEESVVETEEDQVEIPKNTDYWQTWTTITDIVTEFPDQLKQEQYTPSDPSLDVILEITSANLGEDPPVWLTVSYDSFGHIDVFIEHQPPFEDSESGIFFEGSLRYNAPDPVALCRRLASIELSYLVYATNSCAAGLDYWQTNQQDGWYQQHEWAKIRDVNRQTVNDRVRHTRRSLQNES